MEYIMEAAGIAAASQRIDAREAKVIVGPSVMPTTLSE
jgi:hypothetical protein